MTEAATKSTEANKAGLFRIGEVAERLGVSERTLRYYEELGLLEPSAHSPGGSRRYSQSDLDRVHRIREIQSLMGFNLDEIHVLLSAEDRLDSLRTQWRRESSDHKDILEQAIVTVDEVQEKVRAKMERLANFLGELQERGQRYKDLLDQEMLDGEKMADAPSA